MKINFESLLIGLLLVTIVILKAKSCNELNQFNNILANKQDSINTWKDESGRWHAATIAAQLSKDELKKYYEKEVEEIRRDYNVKVKNVAAYLKADLQSSQVIRLRTDSGNVIKVSNINGIDTAIFHYDDPWLTLSAQLHDNDLIISRQNRDSVSFLISQTRSGILGPTTYRLNGISYNPNSVITGLSGVMLNVPNRRLGIGPYVGYGFVGYKFCFNAGISFHYSLIRF